MERTTVYFDNPGKENTEQALEIAAQRAADGIEKVLVASTSGYTARLAVQLLADKRVIIVSHAHGFKANDEQQFDPLIKAEVEAQGAVLLTTTHAFSGVTRSIRDTLETSVGGDIIAHTLRTLGQGMKVVCEIALMAADAGLVRTDESVICIGGSGGGADTVITCRPVNSSRFFTFRVQEILCKPYF